MDKYYHGHQDKLPQKFGYKDITETTDIMSMICELLPM